MILNLLSANPTKWSNTQTIRRQKRVFDHFVGLALKGLISFVASNYGWCLSTSRLQKTTRAKLNFNFKAKSLGIPGVYMIDSFHDNAED